MKPQDRPSLEETYAVAISTSDLTLPQGPSTGAGAQGILAAAAWTEVHLGSALRRLVHQWQTEKPTRRIPRTREQLMAAGLSRDIARALHKRERVQFAEAYYRERNAVLRRLRELPDAREHLTMQAARWGMDDADLKAFMVLHYWLDRRGEPPFGEEGRRLVAYLDDCRGIAKAELAQGMRGHTKHEKAE